MERLLNKIILPVKNSMVYPARLANNITKGRIQPIHFTVASLLGHLVVLWALWNNRPVLAAVSLAVFGIMDAMDGALARLQKTVTILGMYYDATSDRLKEIIVYIGIAKMLSSGYFITSYAHFDVYWLAVAACGGSLLVSYVKAKGEMAVAESEKHSTQALNRLFSDGLARYEVRTTLLILGLLAGLTVEALVIISILTLLTAAQRVVRIRAHLKTIENVQS